MKKTPTIKELQQEIKSYKSLLDDGVKEVRKLQKDNEKLLNNSLIRHDKIKKTESKNKELKQELDKLKSKITESQRWIDAEKKRPEDFQKIIIESAVGLYWGIFSAAGNGKVFIQNRRFDISYWYDIYRWIPYPNDEK